MGKSNSGGTVQIHVKQINTKTDKEIILIINNSNHFNRHLSF